MLCRQRATKRCKKKGSVGKLFAQLLSYLQSGAPWEYILQTFNALNGAGRDIRRKNYLLKANRDKTDTREKEEILRDWRDDIPAAEADKYRLLSSYWNLAIPEHVQKLRGVLHGCMVVERRPQREVEIRLRFLHFEHELESKPRAEPAADAPSSYLRAVNGATGTKEEGGATAELDRLRRLCLQPAIRLTKLRERTTDEDKALLLIINGEIELVQPPHFLVQSMSPEELARFTDIFLSIEYPLYAHLEAGQRFGDSLSKQMLLSFISVAEEAAPAQKQEVAAFKEAVSRITLDALTRVITVTFKGKRAAQKWVNWKMPMTRRLLALHDYEQQREEAKVTNAVVKLDFYEFTVAVRKGTITSTDMLWVLTKQLGLKVHTMLHSATVMNGLNDKQWTVRIEAEARPATLFHPKRGNGNCTSPPRNPQELVLCHVWCSGSPD